MAAMCEPRRPFSTIYSAQLSGEGMKNSMARNGCRKVFPLYEYNTIMVMTFSNDYDNNDVKGIGTIGGSDR